MLRSIRIWRIFKTFLGGRGPSDRYEGIVLSCYGNCQGIPRRNLRESSNVFRSLLFFCYEKCFLCYELGMLQSSVRNILRDILWKELSALKVLRKGIFVLRFEFLMEYAIARCYRRSLGLFCVCAVWGGRCCREASPIMPYIASSAWRRSLIEESSCFIDFIILPTH